MEAQAEASTVFELERVAQAARDALTDEMVARLADTAAEALDLIDRLNRSGLAKAIPVLAQMANNGDLERLAQLARVYGSAQDAVTDEMVARLAEAMGSGLSFVDRLNRSGAERLVAMLERLEAQGTLERIVQTLPQVLGRLEMIEGMLACFEEAAKEADKAPAAGGFGGLWRLVKDRESQEALGFFLAVGKALRKRCASR